MAFRSGVLLLLALGLVLGSPASAGEGAVFHWIDASGTAHYTDRAEEVPPRYRDQLEGGYVPSKSNTTGFVVVPGIDRAPGGEDEAVRPLDAAAYETRAQQALSSGGGWNARRKISLDEMPSAGELFKMGAPIILAAVGAALLLIGFFLAISVFILKLACHLLGESSPHFLKGFGVVVTQSVAAGAAGFLVALAVPQGPGGYEVQAGQFSVSFLVNAAILRGMVLDSFSKALLVHALVLTLQLGIGLGLGLAVVAFVGLAR